MGVNLRKGLAGHWTMDSADRGNGFLYDRSGRDNHAEHRGGITTGEDGVVGEAYLLNGSDAYLPTHYYQQSTTIQGFTISAWMKSTYTGGQIIFSTDRSEYFRFGTNSSGSGLTFNIEGSDHGTGNNDLLDGNWHHVVARLKIGDTNDVKIFADNSLVYQADSYGSNAGIGSGNVSYGFIGTGSEASGFDGSRTPHEFWNGHLDDIRVYERAVNLQEINALYQMRSLRVITDVLSKGLAAHYVANADSISGSDLINMTPRNATATGESVLTTESGKIDTAVVCNGEHNTFKPPGVLDTAIENGTYTIMFWWKQDDHTSSSEWADVISWYDGMTRRIERGNAEASTNADIWCNLGNTNQHSSSNIGYSSGEWFHTAVRVDVPNNDFSILFNGGEQVMSSGTGTGISTPNNISINTHDSGSSIEQVKFFTRPLSDGEINMEYQRGR